MRRMSSFCVLVLATSLSGFQDHDAQTMRELMAIERTTMDGWLKGDSGPALAASDSYITLFHVMTERRLDGLAAVKDLYAGYGGRPLFDSYRVENPKVQGSGDVAVLSYLLITRNGDVTRNWNATEVYQRKEGRWKVIHSHFSATQATQP